MKLTDRINEFEGIIRQLQKENEKWKGIAKTFSESMEHLERELESETKRANRLGKAYWRIIMTDKQQLLARADTALTEIDKLAALLHESDREKYMVANIHYHLIKDTRDYIASMDGWLEDAVIVLEEGAEPEVGDMFRDKAQLLYKCVGRPNDVMIQYELYDGARKGSLGIALVDKIIQRNGKPVVYKPTPPNKD